MAAASRPFVALIRGIGGATHRAMPLAELCRACEAEGFGEVRNYLSTGNLLLRSSGTPPGVARRVEALIRGFGLQNPVFVRRPVEIRRALATDSFPDASRARPAQMLVVFFDQPLDPEGVAALCARAGPERLHGEGRELYVDFAEGVGRSRLTPAVIERALGQQGTARNWNTLRGVLDRV